MSILQRVAVAALIITCGACSNDDAWQQRKAKTKAELATQRTRLARVVAAWPPDLAPSRPCPDPDIARATSAERVLVMIDWNFLKADAEAGARPTQSYAASMTHPKLQRLNEDDPASVLWARELLDQRPFLAVWRATEFVVPRTATTEQFTGGHARGRLVVFDTRRATPLCWFSIEAKSSPEVAYKTYQQEVAGQALAKADAAVSVDLIMQVQAAIAAELPAVSKELQITHRSYSD
jgi:hypothetical protein